MAMVNVCKDCGLEIHCRGCNACCPVCGGEIARVDYITYIQSKQRSEGDN